MQYHKAVSVEKKLMGNFAFKGKSQPSSQQTPKQYEQSITTSSAHCIVHGSLATSSKEIPRISRSWTKPLIYRQTICNRVFVMQNKMHKWLQDYPNPVSELKPTTHNQQILGILKNIQHNLGTPKTRARIHIAPNCWEFIFPRCPQEFWPKEPLLLPLMVWKFSKKCNARGFV